MAWLGEAWRRLWFFFRRGQLQRDLEEEMREHMRMKAEALQEGGMPPREARYAAKREFGNALLLRERSRDAWGFQWLETLLQDLRYGLRQLRRNPGFTAVAVLSLALGIGATTAVFSIVDTIFLRPLPYPEQDRLVGIYERRLDKPEPEGWDQWDQVSTPTFKDWKKLSHSFEVLTEAVGPTDLILNRSEGAETIMTRHVGEGYFPMLGAKACRGRLFVPDDFKPGQSQVGVLSFEAWQRLFGSNPSIVGNTITVDGKLHHVVGVMCPEFRDLTSYKTDFWRPVNWVDKREVRMMDVIGRLKTGVTVDKAQAELDVIESRLAHEYPAEQKGYGARVRPLHDFLYGDQQKLFLALFGAAGLLLLIGCTNVATLVLARGVAREGEMALRASLGGGCVRLIRQLLTESLLLSSLGTGLGLLLAYGGVRLAVHASPANAIPRGNEISLDVRILAFVVFVTCLTALLFGLFPALEASKPDLNESMKEGGRKLADHRGMRGIQGGLVIAQIAFSLVLLIGAGLMIHNVWRILHASVGFNADHLTHMWIQFTRFDYMERIGKGSPLVRMKPKAALAIKGIEDRLKALPGVTGVGISARGVLLGCNGRPVSTNGPPRRDYDQMVCYEPVNPTYFRTLEIPVLQGRVFANEDTRGSPPVAVISQKLANQYFPGQDPIGKTINIGIWESDEFLRRQVVGVVGDVRWRMNDPPEATVYYPYSQLPAQFREDYSFEQRYVSFVVRSATDPTTLVRAMERAVKEVAKDVVVQAAWTAHYTRWRTSQQTRFFTWLLAVFAGTSLVLAAVGVFGVMSYSVSRRTHELGVRMALGAHPHDVLRLVLRAGVRLTLIGLAIGLGGAMALMRVLGSNLTSDVAINEVKPTDPAILIAVPFLLAVVALLACYIPARRASKVDPMVALRYE